MAGSKEEYYRLGMINNSQMARFKNKTLSKTKVNRPSEESFLGTQGRRDQGGRIDRGDKAGQNRHIDYKQDMGTPQRGSGQPSPGGRVGAYGSPVKVKQIDDASTQKPDFPDGKKAAPGYARTKPPGGGKPAMPMKKAPPPPRKLRGTGPKGAMQKSGAQSPYYGAGSSRP